MGIDNIFKELNNILRYSIPGIVLLFFISLNLSPADSMGNLFLKEFDSSIIVFFILSTAIGYLTYSLYRTVIYPFLHLLVTLFVYYFFVPKDNKAKVNGKFKIIHSYVIFIPAIQDIQRFLKSEKSKPLENWASFIHLNYQLILVSVFLNRIDYSSDIAPLNVYFNCYFLCIFGVFNLWHHIRYMLREFELLYSD
jgi:hypothetical protein